MYKKGYTQFEITQELAVTKHLVGKVIRQHRSSTSNKNEFSLKYWKQRLKKSKVNPKYGYYVFQGELCKDPKEFPVVQLILGLWKQGKRIYEIRKELAERKIKPRKGGVWDKNMVKKIIVRELDENTDSNIIQIKRKKGG